MHLHDVVQGIPGFSSWTHVQKIKFFGWYLHSKKNRQRFSPADLRACYDELHLEKPSDVNPYIYRLKDKKPSEVLHDRQGYRLALAVREEIEKKYGQRAATIQVDKLLSELSGKISDENEQVFLNEALICFRNGAFRAAIVMAWNLAYFHLEDWIFDKKLAEFNADLLTKSFKVKTIASKDHFAELREFELIDVCKSAKIISINLHKILKQKLEGRNIAAHPSNVKIDRLTAEEFISSLVNNIVLKIT